MSLEVVNGPDAIPLARFERVKSSEPDEKAKARLLVSPHVTKTLDSVVSESFQALIGISCR
jgi:hypothetical protein